VRQVGPDLLESLDSVVLTATPEKLTPPPPLLNLVAAATPKGMELQWDASPAPDLAGYRVYRRQSGESRFTLLNRELLKKPYYLDAQASRGKTYYYYVTAVDNTRRANESSPSETAEVHY
jgi:fibronectin type 3 domain-containing protein